MTQTSGQGEQLPGARSPQSRSRQIFLGLLWLSLAVYAFGFAPPSQPDTLDTIVRLSTGQWDGLNPLVVSLFNLMGVWPLLYAGLALSDGRQQSLPAWPFVALSFGVGAFALLPYLALRQRAPEFTGAKTGLLKLSESRWVGVVGAIAAAALLVYALTSGNLAAHWQDFMAQWQTSRFIHIMSLDFCLLCALVPTLLGDDMARRHLHRPALVWAVTLVPLLGLALYLTLRPPLPEA